MEQAVLKEEIVEVTEHKSFKDFEDIVKFIGSHGRYQKILLYAVLCPIVAYMPYLTMNIIFMLYTPNHWCHVPGRDNGTNIEAWKNITLPRKEGTTDFSQCKMYLKNGTVTSCLAGWEFDTTDYSSTAPTDHDWYCEKAYVTTSALTAISVGNVVGTVILGTLADKYGRKLIIFVSMFINIFFRFVSLYIADNIGLFLLTQFLVGTGFPILYIAPTMIAAEISDSENRAWIYMCVWVIWVVGMGSLPLLAWISRTWFLLGILTTIPGFCFFLCWPLIPESPRWLLSKGRVSDATKIMIKIATKNGTGDKIGEKTMRKVLQNLYTQQREKEKTRSSKYLGVWTLFTKRMTAKNTILITASWSINVIIYYAITLNTTNMSGNQFLNFFLLSMIELPAGWLGGVMIQKVGRRWTQVLFFFFCALFCALAAIGESYNHMSSLSNISVLVAKFAVTLTFFVVYVQAAEIFPTELRSTGNGFASTVASGFGILAPFIVSLDRTIHHRVPYIIMGALSLMGMLTSSFLPETLNQNLPETIQDASKFGKNERFWSLKPDR